MEQGHSGDSESSQLKVLRVAMSEFLQYGYSRTKTANIAGLAGVSEPTLFRHWRGGKRSLFQDVYNLAWRDINGRLTEIARRKPELAQNYRELLRREACSVLELWEDPAARPALHLAFLYARRPSELGDEYKSPEQATFENRLQVLADALVDESASSRSGLGVEMQIFNTLAAAVLTWGSLSDSDFTVYEAQRGIDMVLDDVCAHQLT